MMQDTAQRLAEIRERAVVFRPLTGDIPWLLGQLAASQAREAALLARCQRLEAALEAVVKAAEGGWLVTTTSVGPMSPTEGYSEQHWEYPLMHAAVQQARAALEAE
jgi:hypothetical protein